MTHPEFPRLDILPSPQRRLWDELACIPEPFTLYGGTAVALHLGHRQSIDFDFFGRESFDPRRLANDIPILAGATVTQIAPDTLSMLVDRDGPVRVSFFALPALGFIDPPAVAPGNALKIASLIDLAGTKASVVQARAEAKDYIDIDGIISRGIGLERALAAARALYGDAYHPLATLKALTYFEDGNLATLDESVRQRLVEAVRAVDLDRLPALALYSDADTRSRPF